MTRRMKLLIAAARHRHGRGTAFAQGDTPAVACPAAGEQIRLLYGLAARRPQHSLAFGAATRAPRAPIQPTSARRATMGVAASTACQLSPAASPPPILPLPTRLAQRNGNNPCRAQPLRLASVRFGHPPRSVLSRKPRRPGKPPPDAAIISASTGNRPHTAFRPGPTSRARPSARRSDRLFGRKSGDRLLLTLGHSLARRDRAGRNSSRSLAECALLAPSPTGSGREIELEAPTEKISPFDISCAPV